MNHAYLSETEIHEALVNHRITTQEAEKLIKKIDCQLTIYKKINK